jgi:hypothetical protein
VDVCSFGWIISAIRVLCSCYLEEVSNFLQFYVVLLMLMVKLLSCCKYLCFVETLRGRHKCFSSSQSFICPSL